MSCLLLASKASANKDQTQIYYSAVSPEFPNGLHTKFLQYVGQELDIKLSIGSIPFARRIKELNKGNIDIMVGVSSITDMPDNCLLIYPAYETMTTSLFTKKGDPHNIRSMETLKRKIVAITRSARIRIIYGSFDQATIVEVDSLRQKIELLSLGRVDAFIHLKHSTLRYVQNNRLEERVELVPFSDTEGFELHIAINKNSELRHKKDLLQKIVREGVANGDFAEIRAEHYATNQ